MIVCHPDNVRLIRGKVSGEEIIPNAAVPKRNTAKLWIPPAGDRFTSYDVLDEVWMRPFLEWTGDPRYGRFEEIDFGPLFYRIDSSILGFYRGPSPLVQQMHEQSELDRIKTRIRFEAFMGLGPPSPLVRGSA